MRNTKKVIAATAAVATLVGLAACGSSNDNGANKGDADKAELVFWGWDSGNSMKEILADFEKANPHRQVQQHRHRREDLHRALQRHRRRQRRP